MRFARLVLLTLVLALVAGCTGDGPRRAALYFSPAALPEGRVGEPYSAIVRVGNAETPVCGIQVTLEDLPPGLNLEKEGDGARISGTPRQAGRYGFTISASCYGTQRTGQSGAKSYEIVVHEKE